MKRNVVLSIESLENFIFKCTTLIKRIEELAYETKFNYLYVESKHLFSIGYNIEDDKLTNSYYDLLSSESRQTSFIAIARGEVPVKHWFKLGRNITLSDGYKGMVSWSGTMFEYFMPILIMKSYKNTLLDETYSFALRSQKKYGHERSLPWGVSESGFYSFDVNNEYQYKAIGVPWLGLKRGLIEDAVVAPYATFLALVIDPISSIKNLKTLRSIGAYGEYGFFEAIDYTPERLPLGVKHSVIKNYMVHHLGMSFLALNNCINNNIMQTRFHSDPQVEAAKLLLFEKIPANIKLVKAVKEKVIPFKAVIYKEKGVVRSLNAPDKVLPKVNVLSNGNYTVFITDRGTGFSKVKTAFISRWREDVTVDAYGMFFYIRNVETNSIWSATFAPFNVMPMRYEANFSISGANFKRYDENIETETKIVVSSIDNAEIRNISIKNRNNKTSFIEVTSFFEVILTKLSDDIAHPAFSNLFIKTEFLEEENCLIAYRRPISESQKGLWNACTVLVDGQRIEPVEYETDKLQFIGRGGSVSNPDIIMRNKPLTNTVGAVLDPILSLRVKVKIEHGKVAKISFINIVSDTYDGIFEVLAKFKNQKAVESQFKLSITKNQVLLKHLNFTSSEYQLFYEIISHIMFISPLKRQFQEYIQNSYKGQSSLWTYGISGDYPIILVEIQENSEIGILYEILQVYDFFKTKDIRVDIVILCKEENSYTNSLLSFISETISFNCHVGDLKNVMCGLYILNNNTVPREDVFLLYAVARVVFVGESGKLINQISNSNGKPLTKSFQRIQQKREKQENKNSVLTLKMPQLEYFNGLGGFNTEKDEYTIMLGKGQNTPMPWCNVIANQGFGFIVSESGAGYTWSENSREFKLTPWSNDPVSDFSQEIIYLHDRDNDHVFSMTPCPLRDEASYLIYHGFGYSKFEHVSNDIHQSLLQFVPINESVKISVVRLKNLISETKKINLTYYVRPVLGVSDQKTASNIITYKNEDKTILVENRYNDEFPGRIMFVDMSLAVQSFTCDRQEFFGFGGYKNPQGLSKNKLSCSIGTGFDPCVAMQTEVDLKSEQEVVIILLLGASKDLKSISGIIKKYKNVQNVNESLLEIKKFWEKRLGTIKVNTPDNSMNIMLNGWLLYQIISCRLWARTGFYQSGGAYGFRDQLQDCLAVLNIWPSVVKDQILLHAKHQFIQGDVLHWWHEPQGKGTRTRISDDLLWLPYVLIEYVEKTGDYKILIKEIEFVDDEELKANEDERYIKPKITDKKASLYDHCILAIERALKFGSHGIPLIGSGDWNDGMNAIGTEGKGESIWLGWFLYAIINRIIPIAEALGDLNLVVRYNMLSKQIVENIENNGWDGNWYKRAYFDNDAPLGSIINSECIIDSISQSWAVISGGANIERAKLAMDSVENYLIAREVGLIKLFTPPFDTGDLEPGYIKGYVPGIRENGGQYTHAAVWVIMAYARLGYGDKAHELFNLINPINHTRTQIECSKYKVEPYVMAGDVYTVNIHLGRGGWTWYTGSASWMYKAGLEEILGFKKNGDKLILDPCIPKNWEGYSIVYKYKETKYTIIVKNPNGLNKLENKLFLDRELQETNLIELKDDRLDHIVEVY